jgi:glutamine cyclotransferase
VPARSPHRLRRTAALLVAAIAAAAGTIMIVRGFGPAQTPGATPVPTARYSVVTSYPHDPAAFTQGLQYVDGVFYEGTGLNGRSSIRKVDVESGKVLQQHDLPAEYFGEGITVWNNRLFQLTWQSGIAFVYDRATFKQLTTFRYRGEGWGLTYDGRHLVMSDGTSTLRFLDPETFAEQRRVTVKAGGEPIVSLNELEAVKGEIFANVWQTDMIARINPATGAVTGWIDLRGLLTPGQRTATDVLNGIAYDAAKDRLFVTGKLWPRVFQIALRP